MKHPPVSAPSRRDNLSCMKCRLAVLARLFSIHVVPPSFLRYLAVPHTICRSFSHAIHLPAPQSSLPAPTASRCLLRAPRSSFVSFSPRIKGARNAIREKFRSQIEQVCSRRTAINSRREDSRTNAIEKKGRDCYPRKEILIRDFAIARALIS